MASDGGGESSYESDFMDEDAFNRYLGSQSDLNDSASEVGDINTDTPINHATALPLEMLPLSLVKETHPTQHSSRSANQKPFVLPEGAMVIDLDSLDDESTTSLFGRPQSPRVKEEPQEVVTISVPEHSSDLSQEHLVQKNGTNDTGGDHPVTMTPDGNSRSTVEEDKGMIEPQTDVEEHGLKNAYGEGPPPKYVPPTYHQPTVEDDDEIKEEGEVECVWENLSKRCSRYRTAKMRR